MIPAFLAAKGAKSSRRIFSTPSDVWPTRPCPARLFSILTRRCWAWRHTRRTTPRCSSNSNRRIIPFPFAVWKRIPDPYTFHITLSQPYPQLRYLMAMHFTTPLAHEAVERYGKDLARHPVGSGAFVLAEYTPKGRIVLVKNPNFRADYYPSEGAPGDHEAGLLKAVGQRLPLVEKIQINIVRESITNWNLFLQGYQDFAGVSQENFQQVLVQAGQLLCQK